MDKNLMARIVQDDREMVREAESKSAQAAENAGEKFASGKDVPIRTDYEKATLADLIENSVDTVMEVIKIRGIRFHQHIFWDYFVEFFNCCRKPEFIGCVSKDAKARLLHLHGSKPEIYNLLNTTPDDIYELATEIASENKKEEILKFWDEYVETRKIDFYKL